MFCWWMHIWHLCNFMYAYSLLYPKFDPMTNLTQCSHCPVPENSSCSQWHEAGRLSPEIVYWFIRTSICRYTYTYTYIYIYVYIYIYTLYHHHPLKGGRTQNVSYMFQGVFEGGLENVSLHFEGILTTLPTKTIPGGRSVTKFTLRGGSQKMYLTFW
jgi:hypothetical protein